MEQLMQQMLLLQQQQQQTNQMLVQLMTMIQNQNRFLPPAGGQLPMPQVTTALGVEIEALLELYALTSVGVFLCTCTMYKNA